VVVKTVHRTGLYLAFEMPDGTSRTTGVSTDRRGNGGKILFYSITIVMNAGCIVFALLLSFASTAQIPKTDWDKDFLRGKVKTTQYFSNWFDNPTNPGNAILDSSTYTLDSFSTTGYKIKQCTYEYGGHTVCQEFVSNDTVEYTMINGTVVSRTGVKHGSQGKVVEKLSLDYEGNIENKQVLEYDTMGNLVRETGYDSDTPWKWRMYTHESGRVATERDSTSFGISHKTFYKYNDKGQLIKIVYEDYGRCPSSRVVSYTYDDRGNKVSYTEHDRDSSKKIWMWKYDEHNNIVLEESIQRGKVFPIVAIEYIYDKQGNWIQRTKIFTNSVTDTKTRSVTVRNIEYY
jgi:hypothetical protein